MTFEQWGCGWEPTSLGGFCSEFLKILRFLHVRPVTIEQEVCSDASAGFVNGARCEAPTVFFFPPNIQHPSGSFLEKGEHVCVWVGGGGGVVNVNDVRIVHSCLPAWSCQVIVGCREEWWCSQTEEEEEEEVWRFDLVQNTQLDVWAVSCFH